MSAVLEIVHFKLNPNTPHATLQAAARDMSGWIAAQPGFEHRTLVGPNADGRYTDVVRWRSLEEAHAAAAQIMSAEAVRPFIALIEPSSVEMGHHPIVASRAV